MSVLYVLLATAGGVAVGWYAHREERRMTERAAHETTKTQARFLAHERDIYEEAWIQAREERDDALRELAYLKAES